MEMHSSQDKTLQPEKMTKEHCLNYCSDTPQELQHSEDRKKEHYLKMMQPIKLVQLMSEPLGQTPTWQFITVACVF